MSPQDTPPALECGRDPLEVVDRARAGRSTAHELECPYCQAAVAADEVARRAGAELGRAEDEQDVPGTLLPNVMRGVWSDLRRSAMIPMVTDSGSASVADHVVGAVVEDALDPLADLRVHTVRARLAEADGGDPAAVPTAVVAIEVEAAAAFDADVPAVAAQARAVIRRVVTEQFGWTAEPVDIDVVDVFVHESSPR